MVLSTKAKLAIGVTAALAVIIVVVILVVSGGDGSSGSEPEPDPEPEPDTKPEPQTPDDGDVKIVTYELETCKDLQSWDDVDEDKKPKPWAWDNNVDRQMLDMYKVLDEDTSFQKYLMELVNPSKPQFSTELSGKLLSLAAQSVELPNAKPLFGVSTQYKRWFVFWKGKTDTDKAQRRDTYIPKILEHLNAFVNDNLKTKFTLDTILDVNAAYTRGFQTVFYHATDTSAQPKTGGYTTWCKEETPVQWQFRVTT